MLVKQLRGNGPSGMVMPKMSDNGNRESAGPRADEERPKPDPTAYGRMVDKMAATVAAWPPERRRSVDVHHIRVQSRRA